jgi:hypothetical protein
VRLGTVRAKVRVAVGLLVVFLGLRCHDAVEVVGGLRNLVVEGISSVGFGYVAEVD